MVTRGRWRRRWGEVQVVAWTRCVVVDSVVRLPAPAVLFLFLFLRRPRARADFRPQTSSGFMPCAAMHVQTSSVITMTPSSLPSSVDSLSCLLFSSSETTSTNPEDEDPSHPSWSTIPVLDLRCQLHKPAMLLRDVGSCHSNLVSIPAPLPPYLADYALLSPTSAFL